MYRWRLYAAAKNVVRARRGAVTEDLDKTDEIRRSSARRFIDGGAAIFAALNRNHHIVIAGMTARKPLVRNRLRVEEASYLTLARAKRAGEHSPWASIIVKVPCHPQVVKDIIPAIITPIWATDE